MDNFVVVCKIIVSSIGAFISYLVGGLGAVFVLLLGLMLVDYITGIWVGYVTKELSSKTGTKGFFKKCYVILLIGCIYTIEKVVIHTNGTIGDGVTFAYIGIEFISITENGGKLGVPIPAKVKNVIKVLKDKEPRE